MVSAGFRSEGRDALEQPATPVPGITHDGGDAEGARLEGGAQRVGEKKGRVELCPDPPGQGAWRFPRLDFDHLIDRGDAPPEGSQFGRSQDGEVEVGTAPAASFHRGNTHHGIAEPIARADKEAEGLQSGDGFRFGRVESAPCVAEEEGPGGFPAVVDPEPIRRPGRNLALEGAVEFESEFFHGPALRFAGRLDNAAPPRDSRGMDGHRDEWCAGAIGNDGGQRGGRGEFAEEGGPKRAVPGMLVDQNGEDPAFFHQIDRIQVAFAPVEGPQAQP